MKRHLLLGILLPFVQTISAAIKYWDGGGGDGLWSTAANWNDDIVPAATDDVILDNSLLAANYTVTLPGGAVTTEVLTISLTPQATIIITLLLPVTNTASPGLLISGAGDAFVLNNGAVFRNASGAATGTGFTTTQAFRINNGGHYIHNNPRGTAAILNQLSTVPGTEQGVFEIMATNPASTTLSVINRVVGTFVLSLAPGLTTKTYTATGNSPFVVRSDFIIRSGVTFSCGMMAAITVDRDLITEETSVLNLQNGANSNLVSVKGQVNIQGTVLKSGMGLPTLECNGLLNQSVRITNGLPAGVTFRVNNTMGVTLITPLSIAYAVSLQLGKITTTATNLLAMADGATVVGGSGNSFVEGPMQKIGDDDFVFPVGMGELFSPIGMTNVSGQTSTDVFTAAYKRANPQTTVGNTLVSGMDHISFVEYWSLAQDQGTSVKRVSLNVTPGSFCQDMTNTYVSRWNGLVWTNEGSTNAGIVPVGIYETGTITSTTNLAAFGKFTLITDQPFIDNPLPLQLLSFSATQQEKRVLLSWQLAESCAGAAMIVIERANAGGGFTKIGTVACLHTSFEDLYPVTGINRYRLQLRGEDDAIKYSPIATINTGLGMAAAVIQLVAMTRNNLSLTLSSAEEQYMDMHFVNSMGRRIHTEKLLVKQGITTRYWRLPRLAAGIYYIFGNTDKGRSNVLKVMVR